MGGAVKHWETKEWLLNQGRSTARPETPERERIAAAVDSLPLHWKTAIEIVFYEGGTYGDVAREFGLAGRQSGQYRVRRALAALKEILERDNG